LGGHAAVTERLDNYPGFLEGISGDEFGSRLTEQARRFDVEILGATEVASVKPDGRYRVITTTSGVEYCASAILLTDGSQYLRLGVPGEENFIGAGVHFCATCDVPFYKDREIMVVGGGNS
jgi:thioredoxin reductase (NADPH)